MKTAAQDLFRNVSPVYHFVRHYAVVALYAYSVKRFAEVVKKESSPAFPAFTIFKHLGKLLSCSLLLFRTSKLLYEVVNFALVGICIEEYAIALKPVTPCAAGFLVIAFYAPWKVVVYHVSYIRLVDAHSKGYRCNDYFRIILDERLLIRFTCVC